MKKCILLLSLFVLMFVFGSIFKTNFVEARTAIPNNPGCFLEGPYNAITGKLCRASVSNSNVELPANSNTGLPVIKSLSVSSGPIGAHVTITGFNLASANILNFGSSIQVNVTPSSSSTADFYIPSGLLNFPPSPNTTNCSALPMGGLVTAGNYQISINNDQGTSNSVTFAVTPKTVLQLQNDLLGNPNDLLSNRGGSPINISKNVIACIQTPAQFEAMVDAYFTLNTFASNFWTEWDGNSWGRNWLSERSAYFLGIKGWNMGKANQLNDVQKAKMNLVLHDAADGNHIVYDKCGSEPGNSCSEDYVGVVMAVAAAKLNGATDLDGVEKNYLDQTFNVSPNPEHAIATGLVSESKAWDGGTTYIKMYNHGEENPVYAGILFINLNNAAYAYALAQGTPATSRPTLPLYYMQPAMAPLFQWTQTKVASDGSAYLNTCHDVHGLVVSCGDPGISIAVPGRIPGGKFVAAFLGDSAVLPGSYTFEDFSTNAGGNYDMGRELEYSTYNPAWVAPPTPFYRVRGLIRGAFIKVFPN